MAEFLPGWAMDEARRIMNEEEIRVQYASETNLAQTEEYDKALKAIFKLYGKKPIRARGKNAKGGGDGKTSATKG